MSDQYTQLVNSLGVELDPAKQKTLLAQMNDYILDQSFGMTIAPTTSRVVTRKSVNGLEFRFNDVMYFGNVSLS